MDYETINKFFVRRRGFRLYGSDYVTDKTALYKVAVPDDVKRDLPTTLDYVGKNCTNADAAAGREYSIVELRMAKRCITTTHVVVVELEYTDGVYAYIADALLAPILGSGDVATVRLVESVRSFVPFVLLAYDEAGTLQALVSSMNKEQFELRDYEPHIRACPFCGAYPKLLRGQLGVVADVHCKYCGITMKCSTWNTRRKSVVE